MDLIFDRAAVRAHRRRAAARPPADAFLFDEVAERLAERLDGIQRGFARGLFFGRGGASFLAESRASLGTMLAADLVVPASPPERPRPERPRPDRPMSGRSTSGRAPHAWPTIVADEEFLPVAPGSLDLIVSNLSLHWVNDLPGALLQMRQALKPDGLLLAALAGGETLEGLRQALLEGEIAATGGASPRISPFADLKAMAGLLQRAGFALPVADRDAIDVSYGDPLALMRDLRALGESNALTERRRSFTPRATLLAAAQRHVELFGDAEGRVPARFEILFLTGWAPADSQPRALPRGSARHRLADALAPPLAESQEDG